MSPSNPAFEGLALGLPVMPWLAPSSPAVMEYQTTLRKYAPGLQPDPGTITGWVSAKMFEAAAANLPDPPTSQGILEGLYRLNGSDLGGLTTPLRCTPGQNAPPAFCYWAAQIRNGQWVSPNGAARTCP